MSSPNSSQLMRHISGEEIGRFPVWMMRQAGRYLESYRKIREKHSFWEMVTTPELATQVSLLPVEVLPVDAVIFFSDILTLPYSLGLPIQMKESVGPVVTEPLRSAAAFDIFEKFNPEEHVSYVGQAQREIRKSLSADLALLGFAGAPWTVAAYLVEGKADRHFGELKKWMFSDPAGLTASLGKLSQATLKYLEYQAKSGASMIQLFDTWLSEMPTWYFTEYYRPMLTSFFEELKERKIPAIYFAKGAQHLLPWLGSLGNTGLSVDSLITLKEAERTAGANVFLQGNLDPILLLKGDVGLVRKATRRLVDEAKGLARPAIMNLGHGILPGTPFENAKAFIEEARALWV